MSSANVPFRTDAVVKGSLNVGLISSGQRGGRDGFGGSSSAAAEPTSEAYLEKFEEDLQKKVDNEIEVLVDSLQECVELAKVGQKDRFKAEQDAIEIELKAEAMVRATESLLSLSHILKMFFLLNNEDEGSARLLEANQEQATKNLEQVKEEAKDLMAKLLAKQ